MLFIHPMWDSESERIGKQKCTPWGYGLHVSADLIGFAGGLMLVGVVLRLGWRGVTGRFLAGDLWWLMIPLIVGIVSEVLYSCSWSLALRKGFRYDATRCEASWEEAGERRTYRYGEEG